MSKDYQSGAAPSAQKSHAELIAEMNSGPTPEHRHDREILRYYAYELDAAHKREMDELRKQSGNTAKLRDALSEVMFIYGSAGYNTLGKAMKDIIYAALDTPPRNCDRFNSGDPEKDAQDAWDALGPKDSHISEMKDDFLTALTWLFRKAKKEKVNNGSK